MEKPYFQHDRDDVIFLGRFNNETYWNPGRYDLYLMIEGCSLGPNLVARFSDDPGDYASCALGIRSDGVPLTPIMREAFKRAKAMGHLQDWEFGDRKPVGGLTHEGGTWPSARRKAN